VTAPKTPAKATSAKTEMEAFLLRKALNNAPAWMPEKGDILVGEVVGLRMGNDNGYGTYPVVIYKQDDGEFIALHAFHTLIREQLREAKTVIGKRQMIAYDGKKRKNNATQEEIDKGLADYHLTYVENVGEVKEVKAEVFEF
jgi:hypothetical protein